MRQIFNHFLLFFLLIAFASQGQTSSSLTGKYDNGKDLFGLGKYKLAMEEFRQVITRTENNPYLEYASYYFAVSAYNSGQSIVANTMFHQIERKYPEWDKIDEVFFWLAKIDFESNDYLGALININRIQSRTIAEEARKMKNHFLAQLENVDELNVLLSKNPYDKDIAEFLAEAIIKQPIVEQDRSLLEFLVNEFELNPVKYDKARIFSSRKKDSYNVAVVLPLMIDKLQSESLTLGRNLVLDLYEGIKVGVDKLEKSGIKINLFAFDTKKDSLTTRKLIENGELSNMDLIIGPLSEAATGMLSNYCFERRINMVNPLSYNSRVIGNNPFSFLFKPSLETQAFKAAEYAAKNFERRRLKIFYGESVKDSVLAHSYKSRIEVDSFEVVGIHKISAGKAKDIITLLNAQNLINETNEDSLGHVFLASDNGLLMANIIAALEARGDHLPLIGTESWLNTRAIEFDQVDRLGISIISPNYIDYSKESIELFRKFYHNRTNVFPSKWAYNGYALMNFFGKMLSEHGVYFQIAFKNMGQVQGEIYEGFNYTMGNDNQYTPLVKFIESELKVVNK
ncbi:ABC transporter substrate-binding protein [Fulvivirgaceae bacterium BMA12]|uniref:ABC transporter substrate-binding protein n=1 Tax=Agaribacillus aureus TaxID=3051825 RepID=A0ABT8LA55_9BACT|nr:ABC transporter substrate-binding protein [Fulvivirgaceae bacterium BMA12]